MYLWSYPTVKPLNTLSNIFLSHSFSLFSPKITAYYLISLYTISLTTPLSSPLLNHDSPLFAGSLSRLFSNPRVDLLDFISVNMSFKMSWSKFLIWVVSFPKVKRTWSVHSWIDFECWHGRGDHTQLCLIKNTSGRRKYILANKSEVESHKKLTYQP